LFVVPSMYLIIEKLVARFSKKEQSQTEAIVVYKA